MYTFAEQFEAGQRGEYLIDGIMGRFVDIKPVTRQGQRKGIDRIFKGDGERWKVEYKTDFLAGKTGNVFLETVSVDTADKKGWLYTSDADYLLYYVPDTLAFYLAKMEVIRRQSLWWQRQYPKGGAKNPGYSSEGILVPLREFERYCDLVLQLSVNIRCGRERHGDALATFIYRNEDRPEARKTRPSGETLL